jgi:glycopeptide antibiotics resistance protein
VVAETALGIDVHPSLASLTCSSATLPSGSTAQAFCVRNARGNFLLFFPLGILIPLVWRRLRFWRGMQIAIAVSCSIELVQYLSRAWGHRTADVNDVILNVLGRVLAWHSCFCCGCVAVPRPRFSPPNPARSGSD